MMVLAMLRVAKLEMPAVLSEIVELVTVRVAKLIMPPPTLAVFPEMVELVRVRVPLLLLMPPPSFVAVLLLRVEFVTVAVPAL